MPNNEFIPPNSQEAEESILAAVLIDNQNFLELTELKAEHFYSGKLAKVFGAMGALFRENNPINLVSLKNALEKSGDLESVGGVPFVANLIDNVPQSVTIDHHIEIIRGKYQLREMLKTCENIRADIRRMPSAPPDAILEAAEKAIFEIIGQHTRKAFTPLGELVAASYDHFERLAASGGGITGLETGFSELDEITAGFQNSDLIILAARPAMGKTAMALQFAREAARQGKRTAFFSVEMGKEQLSIRMISQEGAVDTDKTKHGRLNADDFSRIAESSRVLSQLPIEVNDDSAITVQGMQRESRRLAAMGGLDLVIIDYMQLMYNQEKGERRDLELAEISRALKGLAKELNIPVIALSQLNRELEKRADKRPMLSDLRESGAIEQDADIVLMLFREEVYNKDPMLKGTAELLIRKHRNGQCGTVHLVWEDRYVRFRQAVTL